MIFDGFVEAYLNILKRFLLLKYSYTYHFIQFLHKICLRKILEKLFLSPFFVGGINFQRYQNKSGWGAACENNLQFSKFYIYNLIGVKVTKDKIIRICMSVCMYVEEFNCLPCIYWLPEMRKIPSGAGFIIAGKKFINKQLRKHVTSAFKLWDSQRDACHKKKHFSGSKTFWVMQDNSLVLGSINKINKRKYAKQISTFDFFTLYTKLSHDELLDALYKVLGFVFMVACVVKIKLFFYGVILL